MGSVYEAIHRDLKKRVAVKTLLPALAASAEAKERFFREGEAASRIRHPNVVDVTDVGAEGPITYLVMELLQGEDLAGLIRRQGPLPFDRAADIMLPVMAAITTAHEQGVVHRDLKPENIFLATSDFGAMTPKVLDFGISKVLDAVQRAALTGTAVTLGTAYYLPPEQLRGSRQADARGDQYALGAILYECLTGRRAFDADSLYAVLKAVSDGTFPPAHELRPDLPPALEATTVRAMQVEPTARFASVRQLGAALLPFASPSARSVWQGFFSGERTGLTPAPIGTAVLTPAALPTGPGHTSALALAPQAGDRAVAGGNHGGTPSADELAAALGRSRSRLPLIAGLVVAAVVGLVIAAMRHESATPATTTATTEATTATPAPAEPAVAAAPPAPAATTAKPTEEPVVVVDAAVSPTVAPTISAAAAPPVVAAPTTGPGNSPPRARRPHAEPAKNEPAGTIVKPPSRPARRKPADVLPNNAPIVE
jgi:serine/threonine-protein kinase